MSLRWTLLALLGLLLVLRAASLTVVVDPHADECFYQEVPRGEKVVGSYNVAAGGFLDIDVKITGPDGKVVFDSRRETDGDFSFIAAQEGLYTLCFSNAMSTLTPKTISFNFLVGNSLAANEVAKKEHLTPLESSVVQLSENLHGVMNEQKYILTRERVHRDTTESTNARVLWWSIVEAVALVGMNIWQIMYLKRFFEVKRVV